MELSLYIYNYFHIFVDKRLSFGRRCEGERELYLSLALSLAIADVAVAILMRMDIQRGAAVLGEGSFKTT